MISLIEKENPMINNNTQNHKIKALKMQLVFSLIIIFILVLTIAGLSYNQKNSEGTYNPYSGTIAIYKYEDLQKRDYTYLHERCHAYYYEFLNKSERERYSLIYKNTTKYPTNYSKESVEEDFADSCRHFTVGYLRDKPRLMFFEERKDDIRFLNRKK